MQPWLHAISSDMGVSEDIGVLNTPILPDIGVFNVQPGAAYMLYSMLASMLYSTLKLLGSFSILLNTG